MSGSLSRHCLNLSCTSFLWIRRRVKPGTQRSSFRILVIGSVVLDEDGALPAVGSRQLLQKCQVGGGVENRVLPVMETRSPEFDGTQNFDVLAFAGDGDFRRMAHPAPSGMQGRVLAETGFVGTDQGPVL